MNIYEKMSKATEKINKVAKGLIVGTGKNQYKAVGEAAVLEAVKPIEIEFGIYSFPFKREILTSDTYTTVTEYSGNKSEKTMFFMRIKTIYRFVNVGQPDDYIDIVSYGDGIDLQDKAPGKAMTYADKYALLKAYKVETGDDPDQRQSKKMNLQKQTNNEQQIRQLIEKANQVGIDVAGVAQYFKVAESELTSDQINWAINRKLNKGRQMSNDTV